MSITTQLCYSTDLLMFYVESHACQRDCSHTWTTTTMPPTITTKKEDYHYVKKKKYIFFLSFQYFPLHTSLTPKGKVKIFVTQGVKLESFLLILFLHFWQCKALWDLADLNIWLFWELEIFRVRCWQIFAHCFKIFFNVLCWLFILY